MHDISETISNSTDSTDVHLPGTFLSSSLCGHGSSTFRREYSPKRWKSFLLLTDQLLKYPDKMHPYEKQV